MASWNFPNEVTIFSRPFSSQLKSDPHCPRRQTKQHDVIHQGVVTSDAVAAFYSTSDGCDLPWGGLRILPWQRKKWSPELALRSWEEGGRQVHQAGCRAGLDRQGLAERWPCFPSNCRDAAPEAAGPGLRPAKAQGGPLPAQKAPYCRQRQKSREQRPTPDPWSKPISGS